MPSYSPSQYNVQPSVINSQIPDYNQMMQAFPQYNPPKMIINTVKESDYKINESNGEKKEEIEIKIHVHQIVYGDTLDGLSFDYGVSKAAIKKMNKIESDEIYFLKEIKIPNPSIIE